MHDTFKLPPISGLILAGGRGQRMGGIDKGLADYRGAPLVATVLERLRPQVAEVQISANRNLDTYASFGTAVFADQVGGFAGPLAGIHAGLCHARHELVAVVPCDSPLLPTDLVVRLYRALQAAAAEIAVATIDGRSHPVFCLCRRALASDLQAYLLADGRRVDGWQRSRRRVEVAFDDVAAAFANLNSAEALRTASEPPGTPPRTAPPPAPR